jgi:hypothetical protein
VVKTGVLLGGSDLFWVQALPRIYRGVFGSFLVQLGIWLGCYGQEWHYGLNSEFMWALSQISQQMYCVSSHGLYYVECADYEQRVSKIGSSNMLYVSGDRIMKVLICWANNRTSNKFILVHVAACCQGQEELPGAS